MNDQSASVSFLQVTDEPADSLGVPLAHIGVRWAHDVEPAPGDLCWADGVRLARLVGEGGVLHLLLADGTSAPAAGRIVRKVLCLLMEEDQGFPGNLLIPAPWVQEDNRHGG